MGVWESESNIFVSWEVINISQIIGIVYVLSVASFHEDWSK